MIRNLETFKSTFSLYYFVVRQWLTNDSVFIEREPHLSTRYQANRCIRWYKKRHRLLVEIFVIFFSSKNLKLEYYKQNIKYPLPDNIWTKYWKYRLSPMVKPVQELRKMTRGIHKLKAQEKSILWAIRQLKCRQHGNSYLRRFHNLSFLFVQHS